MKLGCILCQGKGIITRPYIEGVASTHWTCIDCGGDGQITVCNACGGDGLVEDVMNADIIDCAECRGRGRPLGYRGTRNEKAV